MTQGEPPYIKGDRLYLREVRRSDVTERYRAWLNDPEVNRFLETRFVPRSLENIASFVEAMDGNPDSVLLAICLKQDDRHIGNIKLGPINWIHRTADISLFIGEKSTWGQGYATEAISAVTAFAFERLDLRKCTAGAYILNVGSIRAFEKAGYEREGLLRAQWFCDGAYTDEVLLGAINAEWARADR
jgi:RimJ/RimL family protein N-acetyltransferase